MKNAELIDKVFKPGNLVHGTSLDRWSGISREGLIPRFSHFGERYNKVCFSLMFARKSPPDIYRHGNHYGPKPDHGLDLAIIASKDMILEMFPDQVFAIGEHFHRRNLDKDAYYKPKKGKIFDIPIRPLHLEEELSFSDEVAVYPKDDKSLVVPIDSFEGIVVRTKDFGYLKDATREVQLPKKIPVFSVNCNYIGTLS